jgi:hypothetical protein
MKNKIVFHLKVVIAIWTIVLSVYLILSQSDRVLASPSNSGWSNPVNIYTSPDKDNRNGVLNPRIILDSRGYVHAFWSVRTPGSNNVANYIMYSRLENGIWISPIEIIGSVEGRDVSPFEVVIDHSGFFHMVWYGRKPGTDAYLYYSRSYVDQAGSAQNWSTPVPLIYYGIESLYFPATLKVDSSDRLNLVTVYGNFQTDLTYLRSDDSGQSWTKPIIFSGALVEGVWVWQPRMAIDEQGVIHLVWLSSTNAGITDIGNVAQSSILYSRSDDQGHSWTAPYILGTSKENYIFSDANIIIDGTGITHVVWNSSVGGPARFHRYSRDGGKNWSDLIPIYPGSGRTQLPSVALDSKGRVHLVSSGNAYGTVVSLVYTWWDGTRWTDITSLTKLMNITGEAPQIAIGLGTELHMIWLNYAEHSLSYISRSIDDASPLAPALIPSLPVNLHLATPVISPAIPANQVLSKTQSTLLISSGSYDPNSQSNIIFWGLLPVFVLLIIVVLASRRRV